MDNSFKDHAANERTFLAWIRTSVAIMALGFVVERFSLFLQIAAARPDLRVPGLSHGRFGGIALIIVGVLMIVIATARFLGHKRAIDGERPARTGSAPELLLALLLVLTGLFLAFFLGHPLTGG